jgi:hypothetical protein
MRKLLPKESKPIDTNKFSPALKDADKKDDESPLLSIDDVNSNETGSNS